MTNERQPYNQADLQERLRKTGEALKKVSTVSLTIGETLAQKRLTGLDSEQYLEAASQVVKDSSLIRDRLEGIAKPYLLARKKNLEREIEILRDPSIVEEKVERIRRFAQNGSLPAWVLSSAEGFLDRVKKDNMKRSEARKRHPVITISEENKNATIANRSVEFTDDINWALFLRFAKKANQEMPAEELVKVAQESGSPLNSAEILVIILRKIVDPESANPNLITREGSIRTAVYRLNAIVRQPLASGVRRVESSPAPPESPTTRMGKVNRSRKGSQKFPTHGRSIKTTILPAISKSAEDADKKLLNKSS